MEGRLIVYEQRQTISLEVNASRGSVSSWPINATGLEMSVVGFRMESLLPALDELVQLKSDKVAKLGDMILFTCIRYDGMQLFVFVTFLRSVELL
jgi:hypothetical protein